MEMNDKNWALLEKFAELVGCNWFSIIRDTDTNEYKVLYFYRPNCGICGETTPKIAEIYDRYKDSLDLEVFAVNLGAGYNEWINYITTIGAQWKNVRGTDGDSSDIYARYYLKSIPTIYLLKDNVVIAKDIDYTELEKILNIIIQ